jgi:hypothetical protein
MVKIVQVTKLSVNEVAAEKVKSVKLSGLLD